MEFASMRITETLLSSTPFVCVPNRANMAKPRQVVAINGLMEQPKTGGNDLKSLPDRSLEIGIRQDFQEN